MASAVLSCLSCHMPVLIAWLLHLIFPTQALFGIGMKEPVCCGEEQQWFRDVRLQVVGMWWTIINMDNVIVVDMDENRM